MVLAKNLFRVFLCTKNVFISEYTEEREDGPGDNDKAKEKM